MLKEPAQFVASSHLGDLRPCQDVCFVGLLYDSEPQIGMRRGGWKMDRDQPPSQSWQKLEWNVGNNKRNINNYILQFRASGIRIKKINFFPSLVCTSTQIPIIGWQNRYITKEEGLKLQSLDGLLLPTNDNAAFKALGNAVNSKIVKMIAEKLLIENPMPINVTVRQLPQQLPLFHLNEATR